MLTHENTASLDPELGEKCRIALEQSYGFKIPAPKAVKKKNRTQ